ncbi:hypothetical protein [Grimontia hollisae]|uniref:hypothetical protein n=1 Tax=Grimontia hollisae TaxID=673 RepID=UPI0012AC7A8C|nr:hypothetical protein [Grimontia hollisae]
MPTASKSTQNPKLQKCEQCQAKLKFQEAYRAVRALKSAVNNPEISEALAKSAFSSIQLMIDAMPWKKAQYYEAALDTRSALFFWRIFPSFETKPMKERRIYRLKLGRGPMMGMMPETALIQREEEACF